METYLNIEIKCSKKNDSTLLFALFTSMRDYDLESFRRCSDELGTLREASELLSDFTFKEYIEGVESVELKRNILKVDITCGSSGEAFFKALAKLFEDQTVDYKCIVETDDEEHKRVINKEKRPNLLKEKSKNIKNFKDIQKLVKAEKKKLRHDFFFLEYQNPLNSKEWARFGVDCIVLSFEDKSRLNEALKYRPKASLRISEEWPEDCKDYINLGETTEKYISFAFKRIPDEKEIYDFIMKYFEIVFGFSGFNCLSDISVVDTRRGRDKI